MKSSALSYGYLAESEAGAATAWKWNGTRYPAEPSCLCRNQDIRIKAKSLIRLGFSDVYF